MKSLFQSLQESISTNSDAVRVAADFISSAVSDVASGVRAQWEVVVAETYNLPPIVRANLSAENYPYPRGILPWDQVKTQWDELLKQGIDEDELIPAMKAFMADHAATQDPMSVIPSPNFHFAYDQVRNSIALTLLSLDKRLVLLRKTLVPQKLADRDFWLIAFYQMESALAQARQDPSQHILPYVQLVREEKQRRAAAEQRIRDDKAAAQLAAAQAVAPGDADNNIVAEAFVDTITDTYTMVAGGLTSYLNTFMSHPSSPHTECSKRPNAQAIPPRSEVEKAPLTEATEHNVTEAQNTPKPAPIQMDMSEIAEIRQDDDLVENLMESRVQDDEMFAGSKDLLADDDLDAFERQLMD